LVRVRAGASTRGPGHACPLGRREEERASRERTLVSKVEGDAQRESARPSRSLALLSHFPPAWPLPFSKTTTSRARPWHTTTRARPPCNTPSLVHGASRPQGATTWQREESREERAGKKEGRWSKSLSQAARAPTDLPPSSFSHPHSRRPPSSSRAPPPPSWLLLPRPAPAPGRPSWRAGATANWCVLKRESGSRHRLSAPSPAPP